jgi:hypothetical protein
MRERASGNTSNHTGFPNDVQSRATEPSENVDSSYGRLGSQRVAMHRSAG